MKPTFFINPLPSYCQHTAITTAFGKKAGAQNAEINCTAGLVVTAEMLPVSAAADYLHIKEAGLRATIEQGTYPFGISWRLGDRAAFKIPTLTFIAGMTKGAYALSA